MDEEPFPSYQIDAVYYGIDRIGPLQQFGARVKISRYRKCVGVGLIEFFCAGKDGDHSQRACNNRPYENLFIFHNIYILFDTELSLT